MSPPSTNSGDNKQFQQTVNLHDACSIPVLGRMPILRIMLQAKMELERLNSLECKVATLLKALQQREQDLDARHAELESAHLELCEKVPARLIGGGSQVEGAPHESHCALASLRDPLPCMQLFSEQSVSVITDCRITRQGTCPAHVTCWSVCYAGNVELR